MSDKCSFRDIALIVTRGKLPESHPTSQLARHEAGGLQLLKASAMPAVPSPKLQMACKNGDQTAMMALGGSVPGNHCCWLTEAPCISSKDVKPIISRQ